MQHVITNSERSAAACPQKWLLRYGMGLRPKVRVRAMDLGTLVHAGLEGYFGAPEGLASVDPSLQGVQNRSLRDGLLAIQRVADDLQAQVAQSSVLSTLDPSTYLDSKQVSALIEDAKIAKSILRNYHHRWYQESQEWNVILNEKTLTANVVSPSGNKSKLTVFGGKVDLVVEINGRNFIVEHKTTTLSPDDWIEKNKRNPQTRSYAWLLQQNGINIDGVIYDIIQSKPPRTMEDLLENGLINTGKRLAKTTGLPYTTADIFLQVVEEIGLRNNNKIGSLDDVDWYRDTFQQLLKRDDGNFWFSRHIELFSDYEIHRTGKEIYYHATQIRQWREHTENFRKDLQDVPANKINQYAEEYLESDEADMFIRQSAMCYQYNRLCDYASLCLSHNAADIIGFSIITEQQGHTELDLAK